MDQTFSDWLCEALPDDVEYLDVANLCASLFCNIDFLPVHMRGMTYSKEYLSESFADFTRRRFGPEFGKLFWASYGANFHLPTDKGHWLEVIASIFKLARQPDISSAAQLLERVNGRE